MKRMAIGAVLASAVLASPLAMAQADKLLLLSAGNTTPLAPVYIMETLGLAKTEGLDYQVKTVMANSMNMVVAGEGDLSVIGVSSALVPVREGKETSIVFAISSGLGTGFMVANPKINSVSECTRVSTSRAGSAVFSSTMAYKTQAKANFNILELGDANQIVPSVLSGGSDCAVSALAVLLPGVEKGLKLLIDPRNPATIPPNTVQDTVSSGLWGMKDNLQKKRPALEKFMRAMKKVEQYMKDNNARTIAEALVKHPDFKTFPVEAITRQVENERPFWFPDGGYVRQSVWPASQRYFQYGLPFIDPNNKIYSWEARVDMSYWISAYGKPARN